MAWFKMSEWEWWNKLALAAALVLGAVLVMMQPLVWKKGASWLAGAVFAVLAAGCVRWLFRLRKGGAGLAAGDRFKRDMSRVMWGVLMAVVLTRVLVNAVLLVSLLPVEPVSVKARLLDTQKGGFKSWVLELEDGTRFELDDGLLRRAPEDLAGQTVRVRVRENGLGYYVVAE
ncbi:hypothetical protein H9Q10_06420 [Eikenella sp. S3360]|uniref:Uncharacterized protein n=1 Tax=Eikenella glucosivorans TaxID=2766967 RepID=A0ABS0NAH3_9NEIS|nr:hypothetical protein [Eikenella glucosivorans]MBH5329302.1 hypothetical protein [Eikenella glucosivorans]